jgi:hypothetical protein
MSDRCDMQIVCRREDAPSFEELGFSFESGLIFKKGDLRPDAKVRAEASVVLLGQGEVNYAASVGDGKDGFGDLPRGLIYYGSHGSGGNFGEGVFASLGKTLEYVQTLFGSNWPAVELKPDGKFDRRSLRQARKYVATLGLVRWALITHLRQSSAEQRRRKMPRLEVLP